MANTVRIRNGMSNATEGDILGNFGDLVGVGVVDKANGHLLVTEDSPRGMSIQVAGGIVYVPNAGYNQLDSDTPKFYPVVCDAEALTIDNNTSGQTRNDIVCVKVDKSIFPDADASNIATKIVVKGTAGGGIPTTPANHYKLANIVVVNGETEITNAEITDTREQVLLEAGTVDSRIDDKMTNIMDIMLPQIRSGWITAGETWTYASADDPTFTFTVSADVTTKYSAGMKIKLTQGTVKYFIITAVSAFSGGNTTITVYGGTDYDLADSAISANAYSMMKSPQGFPMSPAKWSQTTTHTTQNYSITSPTSWQVIGTSISLTIPIGVWNVSYWALIYAERASSDVEAYSTLSTTTSSETNTDFTCCSIGMATLTGGWHTKTGVLALTTKDVYYLIGKTSGTSIGILGNRAKCVIRATCAYL